MAFGQGRNEKRRAQYREKTSTHKTLYWPTASGLSRQPILEILIIPPLRTPTLLRNEIVNVGLF